MICSTLVKYTANLQHIKQQQYNRTLKHVYGSTLNNLPQLEISSLLNIFTSLTNIRMFLRLT